jgi:mono/diheme cytochrome c family protein
MGGENWDERGPQEPTFWTGVDPVAVLGGVLCPVLMLIAMFGLWSLLDARYQHQKKLAAAAMPRPVKLDAGAYARGQQLYTMACLACHGPQGQGVAGLGKDLVKSRFSRGLNDAQLAAFIIAGRGADDPLNTTKVPMPPRGGRADFSDRNIADVVSFLRGLADPCRLPDSPLPQVEIVLGEAPLEPVASAAPLSTHAAAAAPTAGVSTPAVAATIAIDPQAVARGKKAYISCMACHGKDAKGVKNMGKDLVDSRFVASLSDAALLEFIKKGRGPTDPANTTKIAMPPKGGNPALKDAQIQDIVSYIRSLNPAAKVTVSAAAAPAPVVTPAISLPPVQPADPTPAPLALAPAASPAALAPAPTPVKPAIVPTGDAIARGKRAYISCMACHGKDATGVKNMGKNLVNSPFVAGLNDQALVDFIKKGRGPTDPGNTTRIAMPPKGGNPALKDEQINDIVAYLRSLRQQSARTE